MEDTKGGSDERDEGEGRDKKLVGIAVLGVLCGVSLVETLGDPRSDCARDLRRADHGVANGEVGDQLRAAVGDGDAKADVRPLLLARVAVHVEGARGCVDPALARHVQEGVNCIVVPADWATPFLPFACHAVVARGVERRTARTRWVVVGEGGQGHAQVQAHVRDEEGAGEGVELLGAGHDPKPAEGGLGEDGVVAAQQGVEGGRGGGLCGRRGLGDVFHALHVVL
mmetsp:Transcript_32834/g.84116  ORF Transcript_32834/g.84116 Transcript_32834/m.84116 type:complete len:226 (-) Transcript_32834:88-765(-)